ncbi:MAG: GTPase ObgE [Planctomycetes bacterium]|nr:GTPase ObgE [Planctomycetota bacterium]
MFLDELEISVRAGKGGDGCISFLRDANTQRGGPNGGDGGNGGDVVFLPTTHKNTLYHLTGQRVLAARNGQQGGSKDCCGKAGEDLVVELPVGTVVLDAARGNVLMDLDKPDVPWTIARGGYGGRGNSRFATATNRTPRTAETGKDGEERRIRLSLKLIADVGLLGLPNAGKSTLLSALTKARPKIASYPFTTLEPMLGIAQGPGDSTVVVADIPGLIEGAHEGKGLGDKFLKHIERTRLLLHLVDCGDLPGAEPAIAHATVRREIEGHSSELAARPSIVVATKVEDEASRQRAAALATAIGKPVMPISSATGKGLKELLQAVIAVLREVPR